MDLKKLSLWRLVWPIMIELFLQFMIGTADTLMVSRISDDAVAVVGLSNQFFQAVIMLFALVTGGAGIIISQKLGGGKEKDARVVAAMCFSNTVGFGVLVSVVLAGGSGWVAAALQTPDQLKDMASGYIGIVGGGTLWMAAVMALSTVIRSTGNTKGPMLVAIGMNLVHIAGNYGFIFGELGLPKLGLTGVAISTVSSRVLALIALYLIYRRSFSAPIRIQDYVRFDFPLLKEVARLGLPMALSSASWTVSQVTIYSMVATMGTEQLAARTYLNTMESFCFTAGWAFAMAVQIQVAAFFGAGDHERAFKSAYKALFWGEVVVIANSLVLFAFGKQLLSLFTDNPDIIRIGVGILVCDLILQPLKMANMPINNSLNAVGDTRYVMIVSMISMWAVAVGGTYTFGIAFGWLVYGVYAAMITDEAIRAILVNRRWFRRKYLPKERLAHDKLAAGNISG
ncbi:MATE family efflux transporter [Cohnella candidum]|uniref:MATE family efflux transporter n=1 Tax=Cohnella candidum TaxID=2674991 RepID=A0A3G3K3Y3_9BACL|nr:MATE family efflux transporter [Cohnella candidum]AYQ75226.1 MATE family efflux transporter [Cohnella candidum]